MVLKLEQWQGDSEGGRSVMVHEYYHVLQSQTSGGFDAAQWLLEGGASWAATGLRVRDKESTFDDELVLSRRVITTRDAPPLDHAERDVDNWQYTLGALASEQLAQRSGADAPFEFWRALLPQKFGPLGRWQSTPPWQVVFSDVFGLKVEDFYTKFAAWRSGLTAGAVEGSVVGSDGAGLPYVKVFVHTRRLQDNHFDRYESHTSADGSFTIAVPREARN